MVAGPGVGITGVGNSPVEAGAPLSNPCGVVGSE